MNPLNKAIRNLFGGLSKKTPTDSEIMNDAELSIGSVNDFANKKSNMYVKIILLLLLAFLVIFAINVATKSLIKLSHNDVDKKERKVVIPELNLTKSTESKMALLQQAQIDLINQRLADADRKREADNNKTIEEFKKIAADLRRDTQSSGRKPQNYPVTNLPPIKEQEYQSARKPNTKTAFHAVVEKKGSNLSEDDFLPSTAPAEVKKPLTNSQIKQATQKPIQVETAQTKHITTGAGQYYQTSNNGKKSYDIVIGQSGIKSSNANSSDANASQINLPNFTTMKGFAKATLTTGFKAPTLAVGKDNPKPVYLSLDTPVIIANGREMNAEDCMLTASAIGDINSGRAEVRLSEMECIVKIKGIDYKVSEKVEGWVYGEDGEFGLKGRLISPEGKVIDAALPLMAIEAIVGAAKSIGTTSTSTIAGITTTTSNNSNVGTAMKDGAATGFQKSADKLIDYYIKVLDAMQPSIDVKAGRKVVIGFKGGQKLKIEKFEPLDVNYDTTPRR